MLAGYDIRGTLHESRRSRVFRAVRERDARPVILKALADGFPSRAELARLRREFAILRKVDSDRVVKAESLEAVGHGLVMVLEDFGGRSLQSMLDAGARLELRAKLAIAVQIAEAVAELHRREILHKDITPANVVWNDERGVAKLVDFDLATELAGASAELKGGVVEGTLLYIAPEQTGRTSRVVDHRADLYSLGATLYALFAGRPPFQSDDPMEILHAHLAQQPTRPDAIDATVPSIVADIVVKLLAKEPERRYQSALGLVADLRACLAQLDGADAGSMTTAVAPFPLGTHDVPRTLHVPQMLYGREREVERLLAAYARASDGSRELLLVAGFSGIGKSALVQEVHKPITADRGLFVRGKFDQFKRDVAYSAIADALRDLVRQILTEEPEALERWRARSLDAVGANGRVLVDLVPELELLLGPQPEVVALGPAESRARFFLTMQRFVQSVAKREHPLVMFLDDLQWADSASLALLETLLTDASTAHLLVLGAYRDNEVDAAHPFTVALDSLARAGVAFETIIVGPLALDDVTKLVADALGAGVDDVRTLAQLCLEKTRGNPFFLSQFLKALYDDGFIRRDNATGLATFDLARIRAADATDNVVDLMAAKLARFPATTRRALAVAACAGSRFDLQTLALATGGEKRALMGELWPALKEGLLLPIGEAYLFADDAELDADVPFRFLHDRVQQAAYQQSDEREREQIHLQLGRILMTSLGEAQREERIFEIVNHFALGRRLLGDDVRELVQLSLRAGKKAKSCAAFERAAHYFASACALLPPTAWRDDYALAFDAHKEAAECAYLSGKRADAEQRFTELAQHARAGVDFAEVSRLRVVFLNNQTRNDEAVRVGLEGLRALGVDLPVEPTALRSANAAARERVRRLFRERAHELLELSPNTDDLSSRRALLLTAMISVCYATNQDLLAAVVFEMATILFEHGTFRSAPFALVMQAQLAAAGGDFAEADQIGELGIALAQKLGVRDQEAKIFFCFGCFVAPWKRPLTFVLDVLHKAIEAGVDTGDRVYGSYAIHCTQISAFASQASSMDETIAEIDKRTPLVSQLGSQQVLRFIKHASLALAGRTSKIDVVDVDGFAADECLALLEKYQPGACFARALWIQLHVLAGDIDAAIALIPECEKRLRFVSATLYALPMYLYGGIACARRGGVEIDRAHAFLDVLRKWADANPDTFAHAAELLAAEIARAEGRGFEAMRHYRRAIASAGDHGFVGNEGFAHEQQARFYLDEDLPDEAAAHLHAAIQCYSRWGADAKVSALRSGQRDVLARIGGSSAPSAATASSSTTSDLSKLDFWSVVKASQAISREIDLPSLLKNLTRIAAENAGAERGVLFLARNGELSTAADDRVVVDARVDGADRASDAPLGLVHYVARAKESLVLNDAARDGAFTRDAYIVEHRTRSVMCDPVVHQGKLVAVLYLENDLVRGAFTDERRAVLRVLLAQAAISIENAMAYAALRETERIRFEVQTAKTVQQLLVPKGDPAIPGVDLATFYHPASETGGDWFDYAYSGERKQLDLMLGDVTGHGVPAAMLASIVAGFCLSRRDEGLDPAALLTAVNSALFDRAGGKYSMTFSYARIEVEKKLVRYSIAGHHPTYLWRPSTGKILSLGYPSPQLGNDPREATFEVHDEALETGDVLLSFTDGLLENTTARLSVRTVMKLVAANADKPAKEIRDRVVELAWKGVGSEIPDDVTLLVAKLLV